MTKLTKELIEEALKKCNAYHGAVTAPVSVDVVRAMARQLLAGLEQEPVAWKHRLVELSTGQSDHWKLTSRKTESTQGDRFRVEVIPLYAAPQLPQPAVVDDVSIQKAAAWLDGVISSSPGMKEPVTCRAAMLMLSARRNGQKFGC